MNKGLYTRGYLPHWDFKNAVQAVTFRLEDAVPRHIVKGWKQDLEEIEDNEIREKELRRLVAKYEDEGHGSCILRDYDCATIVQDVLLKNHEITYKLLDWCVMPNHVHVMFQTLNETPMHQVLNGWKGASSREINELLGRSGKLWQRESYDRMVRDEDHYYACRKYIRKNPVKARLCEKPEDWNVSSASGAGGGRG
ncbi:MAG: transposase, partial [Akkermansiaceae bacterium]|nr:transposase [Akkermansiaceae bacterium]